MKTIIREITWLFNPSFPISHGYANGYVLIPKGHPWYRMDYDNIPANVHGGLTFSELVTEDMITPENNWGLLNKEDVGKWMIGFDTCHAGDNIYNCSKEYCEKEVNNLAEQAEQAHKLVKEG